MASISESARSGIYARTSAGIYAGTSGWAYPTWKPAFYPAGLPARRFLEHYASRLNSVEVNYTFRSLPTAKMIDTWLAATPANFRFAFKSPQRITHFSRLLGCDAAVEQFVTALEPIRAAGKLGPLLFQLPPNFKADPARLATFLDLPTLHGPAAPLLAFEFRHESWFSEEIYAILRAHNAALCIAESDDLKTPDIQCATTHACYRLRRAGGYSPAEIEAFAEKFSALAATREVYVYFKHEDEPTGALNAVAFLEACAAGAGKR
ncbi:MAG: DUF72 domain-containing protein [Acidobacteriaceae bacterium]|jgi:uncharacterized protein YecE (DUF72 family)